MNGGDEHTTLLKNIPLTARICFIISTCFSDTPFAKSIASLNSITVCVVCFLFIKLLQLF